MKLLKSLAITVTGIFFSTQVLAAFIPLKVQEEDGSPSDSNVKVIKVTNGTLTDNGTGDVSISTGGGDSVSIDSVAVVDPDFVSTGDIDFVDTSNTVTANINAGVIIETDLDGDNTPTDGDILTYDSTGTNFAWITQNAGTDITADLEEEVTEGSLADDTITEAELKVVDTAVDEDILTYESTTGDFEWHTCAEITGSADLCDGNDATGGGAFSDAGDPIVQNTTTKDVHIGDGADTLTGKFEVGADADQPQVVIEGFSTQTDSILVVQRDDNIQIINIDNDGRIRLLDDAGSGGNINMIHNGSNGFIQTTVGGFVINAKNGKQIYQDDGSTGFNFVVNTTTDEAMLATEDAAGNQVIVTNDGNSAKDHDHAVTTNPTLFVHSDTDPDTANDEWISISHDVTDGVIDVGSGGIKLPDLPNCDTIDTDGNGLLSCGTDDGSGAGSVSIVGLVTAQQSATDATELTGFNVTLAANSLSTDNAVRIEGSGTFDEGSTGSGGLNIDVTYGATTVTAFIDHADTTDSVGYGWKAKAYLSADGATNDQQLSVHVIACRQTDTEESCIGDHSTNALAIDSTAGQTLKLTAQQTSGGSGDSITLEYSSAELIQAP